MRSAGLALILAAGTVAALESDHAVPYCESIGGASDVRVPVGDSYMQPDCLTDDDAIEVDWASKRDECLCQALRYAARTERRPVCVLIVREPSECRYVDELRQTAGALLRDYSVRAIGPGAGECADDR